MTTVRHPWWGHDAVEMQLALPMGKRFKPCRDGCGAMIIVVMPPAGENGKRGDWIPLEQVGELAGGRRDMAIDHDLCSNPRVPGAREPTRSHRITVHEDTPEIPDSQQHFRVNLVDLSELEG